MVENMVSENFFWDYYLIILIIKIEKVMSIAVLDNLAGKTTRFSSDEILELWELMEYQKKDFQTADAQTLYRLIKIFAKAYWDSDIVLEQDLLLNLLEEMSDTQKKEAVIGLIDNSMLLSSYVGFALTLMMKLPVNLQKKIKIYPHKVFEEKIGTPISREEFDYRNRCGLVCRIYNGRYYRAITSLDIENFYNLLQVCMLSDSPAFLIV